MGKHQSRPQVNVHHYSPKFCHLKLSMCVCVRVCGEVCVRGGGGGKCACVCGGERMLTTVRPGSRLTALYLP